MGSRYVLNYFAPHYYQELKNAIGNNYPDIGEIVAIVGLIILGDGIYRLVNGGRMHYSNQQMLKPTQ